MAHNAQYAQLLRPIGQMLEGLGVESFSLEVEGDDFVVRGQRPHEAPPKTSDVRTFRVLWQRIRGKHPDAKPAAAPSSGVLELRYTAEDVEQMERAGREKRGTASGTPEAHALSQVLRATGDFVDQKQGRLIALKKEDQTLTIEYESALKRRMTEELAVATLYDHWVRMYLKRSQRTVPKG
jgi:hypothetical protein